jgi:hypothetical protein
MLSFTEWMDDTALKSIIKNNAYGALEGSRTCTAGRDLFF